MDVIDMLRQRFSQTGMNRRIILWHDPDGEQNLADLEDALSSLGVRVWEWTRQNALRTKYQVEVADPDTPYLIYARFPRPDAQDDWLLDIRLYGEEFVADPVAIRLETLGISHAAAREFVTAHYPFFRSQERVGKVARLMPERPDLEHLILATLAAATGAEFADRLFIARRVLSGGIEEEANEAYQALVKWGLEAVFWEHMRSAFGFPQEVSSLRDLFYGIARSHLAQGVDAPLPAWDAPVSRMPNACRIFLDEALRSRDGAAFDALLRRFSVDLGVSSWLSQLSCESLLRCDTVPETHEHILRTLGEQLTHEVADADRWRNWLRDRQDTHGYEAWRPVYEALGFALELQEEKRAFERVAPPGDAKAWFEAYASRWFGVDQLYRRFSTTAAAVDRPGWETLFGLKARWDNWYSHVFLPRWGDWTDQLLRDGWAASWPIAEVKQQRHFFTQYVANHLARERVFVIISDALRYEAGAELADRLKRRMPGEVHLEAMQASLPTYTRLGMASLLPGRTLSIEDSGAVLRDGLPTDSLEARGGILSAHADGALALRWSDFESLPVQEGEERIRGKRLIYFYHDAIDAIGDQARSESRAFAAVDQAIDELEAAVRKLVRSYRAVRVIVTADHGFLYQTTSVEAWAKPDRVTGQVYDGNRRFALGRRLSTPPGSIPVSLSYLGLDVEAVVAAHIHRFTGHGGLRFVHGGALPQEAIVPVVVCHQTRSQAGRQLPLVDVSLVNRSRVVTTYEFTAILFQEQKLGEDRQPRHLRIGLYLDGQRISNEVTRSFHLQGGPADREVRVPLQLFERDYPLGAMAVLRLEDVSGPETQLYREYDIELRIASWI
ncbi:BREX-1 system phosphatase PglZ type A [Alicyclobacillus macrosporangiidus]|uniref:BREX-1 system phosphatase PglZ type A n=1 Tax=Alicyclobacillus macrosporangiidus TaxID=392015 RepID=UPI00049780CE|nr:BREX-1 system phosphatase PglZ type A [Alicyclobacillus macrosporangiidus]